MFIGYHGTNEASAVNILTNGIQGEYLLEGNQIGRGFYIAKMNGNLPQWAAAKATEEARSLQNCFVRAISRITGERANPLAAPEAKPALLKIYATHPLRRCRWGKMNPPDIWFIKAIVDQGGIGVDYVKDAYWLQMVVPPEEVRFLRAVRDDGVQEQPTNWYPKECPF